MTLFWGIYDELRTFTLQRGAESAVSLSGRVRTPPVPVAFRGGRALRAGGVPPGAFAESPYREATVALAPGDMVAIFRRNH